jgi:hypothetical protein
MNLGSPWRNLTVIFTQQLKKLFLVLSDELGDLWVPGANLLKDRL